jgi:DNA-binding NarL/FixJ family response regulator
MIRVLIVDDHSFVLAAIAETLGSAEGIEVVRTCSDPVEAVAVTAELQPDVVVMDINMPRLSGFDAARQILTQDPRMKIILVTGSSTPDGAAAAAKLGSVGYVLKGDCAALLQAVQVAMAGGATWPPGFAGPPSPA